MPVLAKLFIAAMLAVPMIFAIELGPFVQRVLLGNKPADPGKMARLRRLLYAMAVVWFGACLLLLDTGRPGAAGWVYALGILAAAGVYVFTLGPSPKNSPDTK